MGYKIKSHKELIFILIFLIGIVLRLSLLSTPQDMWHDASFTYLFSQKPIQTILSAEDVHPPLYYLIMKGYILFENDTSELTIRLSSMVFYALAFLMLYLYCDKYCRPETKWGALILMSITPTMIYYSLEPRNYMLGVFFVIAQVYFFRNAIDGQRKTPMVIFTILMLYTHYFTSLILIPEFIYLLSNRIKMSKGWILASFIVFLSTIPLVIYFIISITKMQSMWFKDIGLISFISTLSYQFMLPEMVTLNTLLLMVVTVIIIGYSYYRYRQEEVKYHSLIFFLPVITLFLISQLHPLYHHRFFLFFSWALFIVVSSGLTRLMGDKKILVKNLANLFSILFIIIFIISSKNFMFVLPHELHESQQAVKDKINQNEHYDFIHQSTFSQTPYRYYFRNYDTDHYLNTKLTRKQLFTAGGSVVEDWQIINSTIQDEICNDGCIIVEAKENNRKYENKTIYYDYGGLIVYENIRQI